MMIIIMYIPVSVNVILAMRSRKKMIVTILLCNLYVNFSVVISVESCLTNNNYRDIQLRLSSYLMAVIYISLIVTSNC